jgi:LacI family transcriptional regulator
MSKAMQEGNLTQEQLAQLAGVHRITVTKALRGDSSVSAKTRKRVLEVARKAGYMPNAAAVAMRSGRHGAVGLLGSPTSGSGFSPGVQYSASEVLASHDMNLVFGKVSDEELVHENDVPKILREWSVDGLLIAYCAGFPQELVEYIRNTRLPVLWINVKLDARCIYPDDYNGTCQATQRLIEAGHRRVLYEGKPLEKTSHNEHYSLADRYRGYLDAMRDAGLSPLSTHGDQMDSSVLRAELREILQADDRPTGIVAMTRSGMVELFVAAELGMSVPGELSVVAVRDQAILTSWDSHAHVAGVDVSAMNIPSFEIGRLAAERVLQEISRPDDLDTAPIIVPFETHDGETVGPPPQN